MATIRGLTSSFVALSISSSCIRKASQRVLPKLNFSTSGAALGGPISRLRRERAQAKLRKAKARAEELRIQREAKADPIIGHETEFTKSLLRHREILANDSNAVHSRSTEDNWPILTNFGIGSEDSMTLAVAAAAVEKRKLNYGLLMRPSSTSVLTKKISDDEFMGVYQGQLEGLNKNDEKRREVMARLIDLTNSGSKSVMAANKGKALLHFARFEGDTGSPEVQGMGL